MNDPQFNPSFDRNAPPEIPDIIRQGLRYSQRLTHSENLHQMGGVLEVFNSKSGELLWSLVVYENKRHPDLEGDVQDIFFKSMKFLNDTELEIENEAEKKYLVNVTSKTSREILK